MRKALKAAVGVITLCYVSAALWSFFDVCQKGDYLSAALGVTGMGALGIAGAIIVATLFEAI